MSILPLSTVTASLIAPNEYWNGLTITWSAATASSVWADYGPGEEPSEAEYAGLSALQTLRLAAAINTLDKVIAPSLTQVSDASPGQIRVAFTDVDTQAGEDFWGYAYGPPYGGASSGIGYEGDVWIDFKHASSDFTTGSYDFMVLIHELGHALGLKHPFESGATLPAAYDNVVYTVMSYTDGDQYLHWTFEPTGTGIRSVPNQVFPSTPMVFDIAALQAIYGADPTTAPGDDIYTWSESTAFMQAIYDAGGTDTFDVSAHTRGSVIDLTPGAYSSIAYFSVSAQAAYWTAQYGWASTFIGEQLANSAYTWSNNVGIADATVIENALAGSGADSITGNAAANTLRGGAGDDSLSGAAGQDYLRGDLGDDRIVGGADFDDINGNAGNDTAYGGAGADWVVGGKDNDLLYGEAEDDIVYGNLGNDTCDGGAGADLIRGGQADDVLLGGDGDDWLSGDKGSDVVTGGAGADIFHTFSDAGLDRVTDFSSAQGDRVQLDPGTAYSVAQVGADVVITLQAGQMVLVGVSLGGLSGDWIFGA